MSLEGNGGPSGGVPHYLQRSAQASLCSIGSGQSEGSDPLNWESWELRPHDRSRWAMHGGCDRQISSVCPPHRGNNCLTTEALTLLISIRILLEIPKRPEPVEPRPGTMGYRYSTTRL